MGQDKEFSSSIPQNRLFQLFYNFFQKNITALD